MAIFLENKFYNQEKMFLCVMEKIIAVSAKEKMVTNKIMANQYDK